MSPMWFDRVMEIKRGNKLQTAKTTFIYFAFSLLFSSCEPVTVRTPLNQPLMNRVSSVTGTLVGNSSVLTNASVPIMVSVVDASGNPLENEVIRLKAQPSPGSPS